MVFLVSVLTSTSNFATAAQTQVYAERQRDKGASRLRPTSTATVTAAPPGPEGGAPPPVTGGMAPVAAGPTYDQLRVAALTFADLDPGFRPVPGLVPAGLTHYVAVFERSSGEPTFRTDFVLVILADARGGNVRASMEATADQVFQGTGVKVPQAPPAIGTNAQRYSRNGPITGVAALRANFPAPLVSSCRMTWMMRPCGATQTSRPWRRIGLKSRSSGWATQRYPPQTQARWMPTEMRRNGRPDWSRHLRRRPRL